MLGDKFIPITEVSKYVQEVSSIPGINLNEAIEQNDRVLCLKNYFPEG